MTWGMYGLQFQLAKNSLICGYTIFECRYLTDKPAEEVTRRFKLLMGPEGWSFSEDKWPNGWSLIASGRSELVIPVVESVLPKVHHFGMNWNWSNFMVAYTFFDKGVEAGQSKSYSSVLD